MINKKLALIILLITFIFTGAIMLLRQPQTINKININSVVMTDEKIIQLPQPKFYSDISIEEALLKRRSVRRFTQEPLTLEEISQLFWAAQGITLRPDNKKGRTAPSAGATYPLEIYLAVRESNGKAGVVGLKPGVYRFLIKEFELKRVLEDDIHLKLSAAALGQEWIAQAPINIIIGAVYERTTAKYGERGVKYVHMEVGHVGQNISLQAISLNLGTVVVGAFKSEEVKKVVNMAENVVPLYIMPVGRPVK